MCRATHVLLKAQLERIGSVSSMWFQVVRVGCKCLYLVSLCQPPSSVTETEVPLACPCARVANKQRHTRHPPGLCLTLEAAALCPLRI